MEKEEDYAGQGIAGSTGMANRRNRKMKANRGPRRKRMKRPARLQAARTWVADYTGKDLLHGYMRWFGVDFDCAVKEFSLLGIAVDPARVESRRKQSIHSRRRKSSRPKEPEEMFPAGYGIWWDENFAFIAGRTSGGAAYGVTWEQVDESGNLKELPPSAGDLEWESDGDEPPGPEEKGGEPRHPGGPPAEWPEEEASF